MMQLLETAFSDPFTISYLLCMNFLLSHFFLSYSLLSFGLFSPLVLVMMEGTSFLDSFFEAFSWSFQMLSHLL